MNSPRDYSDLAGTTIAQRYELIRLLATGSMASVYEARDPEGRRYAVKIFSHNVATKFPEYMEHLMWVREILGARDTTGLLLPILVGKTDLFAFEVYEFIANARTLEWIIREKQPLELEKSLRIIARLARALHVLHSHSVVHADVKPTNILIRGDAPLEDAQVFLTDFGMAHPIGTEDSVLIVGTYAYMHPLLRGTFKDKRKSTAVRMASGASRVGPFIDIYSLGVVTLQLFTGTRTSVTATDEAELLLELNKNPQIAAQQQPTKARLVRLVSAMLFVRPSNPVAGDWIAQESDEIIAALASADRHPQQHFFPSHLATDDLTTPKSDSEEVLDQLRSVSETLMEVSNVFVSKNRELFAAPDLDEDVKLLSNVNAAFATTLRRTKHVWIITVSMTVCSFALIVLMIVLAVTMALYTGKGAWSLIFGGATVPLVLGTLLWRPFDRMFRSTILTQQLEMVHVQTISAFSSTRDYKQRVEICRDAFNQLTVIFDKHAMPEAASKARSGKPKSGRK